MPKALPGSGHARRHYRHPSQLAHGQQSEKRPIFAKISILSVAQGDLNPRAPIHPRIHRDYQLYLPPFSERCR